MAKLKVGQKRKDADGKTYTVKALGGSSNSGNFARDYSNKPVAAGVAKKVTQSIATNNLQTGRSAGKEEIKVVAPENRRPKPLNGPAGGPKPQPSSSPASSSNGASIFGIPLVTDADRAVVKKVVTAVKGAGSALKAQVGKVDASLTRSRKIENAKTSDQAKRSTGAYRRKNSKAAGSKMFPDVPTKAEVTKTKLTPAGEAEKKRKEAARRKIAARTRLLRNPKGQQRPGR